MHYLKWIVMLSALFVTGILLAVAMPISQQSEVTFLDQNWTDKERNYFYFADQGSRLIEYDYFIHLEQANSNILLRDNANMKRLGFIPAAKSTSNPDALPIGVTRNGNKMGLTCAACHTQQITYQSKIIQIDGGQAFLNLNAFLSELTAALKATLNDEKKFKRFQERVLGKAASAKQIEQLKNELNQAYYQRAEHMMLNHADVESGYTRLDAFGAILNQGLYATGVKANRNSPSAPTSIPYIWDTPQHDYVEWNGSQANTGVGALARNIGEVIGVFGDVETKTTKWLGLIDGGYPSSIQTSELRKLEKIVGQLHSPLWPKAFPSINKDLVKKGRILFEQHCIQCHVDINRTDPARNIRVRMSTLDKILTDPMMAENAVNFKGKSGKFEGRPKYYFVGDPLPAEAPAIDIANNIMVGVIKNNPLQAYLAKRDAKAFGHGDEVHPPKLVNGKTIEKGQEVSRKALLAYKARPLNGVWSSAPYLHNGSVPNLYQLLLPAKARVKQFNLSTWEYDPHAVGYVSKIGEDNQFIFDTSLPGNSNAGHEYGTGYYDKPALTEDERWSLVEYLKTL